MTAKFFVWTVIGTGSTVAVELAVTVAPVSSVRDGHGYGLGYRGGRAEVVGVGAGDVEARAVGRDDARGGCRCRRPS